MLGASSGCAALSRGERLFLRSPLGANDPRASPHQRLRLAQVIKSVRVGGVGAGGSHWSGVLQGCQ